MTRREQDENVVRVQLDIDIAVPIGSARHQTVDPDVGNAMLAQGPQIALNERKPVAVCMCVLMKMSGFEKAWNVASRAFELALECRQLKANYSSVDCYPFRGSRP
jgi:hypothetical protein